MAKSTLYTFGSENRSMAELVDEAARLKAVVVDVRIRPFSWWSDWTKSRLEALLGDRYRWVEGFGNQSYKGGPFVLSDPEAGLEQIADLIKRGQNILLLGTEADPHICHRAYVAELVAGRYGCRIEHLIQGGTQLGLL
jgi:uncharacterized protein (DUF488 family)